jgi:hypothetical protein
MLIFQCVNLAVADFEQIASGRFSGHADATNRHRKHGNTYQSHLRARPAEFRQSPCTGVWANPAAPGSARVPEFRSDKGPDCRKEAALFPGSIVNVFDTAIHPIRPALCTGPVERTEALVTRSQRCIPSGCLRTGWPESNHVATNGRPAAAQPRLNGSSDNRIAR